MADKPLSVHDDEPQKPVQNDGLLDKEVAQYATGPAVEVDEATSKRLKRMIDKRVLVVMMVTYMIQTLDKGALSFASVMGIREDTHLAANEVRNPYGEGYPGILTLLGVVSMAHDGGLPGHSLHRVPGTPLSLNAFFMLIVRKTGSSSAFPRPNGLP